MEDFEVIPAVDLKGGNCVQLRQGKKDAVLFSADNPVEIAREWVVQGAKRLHIIDLDGAFMEEQSNFVVIKALTESEGVKGRAKIQVGGGIRSYEAAVKLLEIGVDRVIFGTAAFKSPWIIERVVDEFSSEQVMVALDARKGKVAIDGWREVTGLDAKEAVKKAEELGAGSLLFTNIDVEGLMSGVDKEFIAAFVGAASVPVVIAGGVSSADDVKWIKGVGASGVVLGSALYKGKLNFVDVV
ncbi:MAG: 1-(5-phosphoribosyl)-5-[(5-phosphoribosylamino)methylideneamino]imidazole-4-carboxamide isomerase [Methanophagales archaeon]|nr:phosphoribosylformimino-5-aminoimidazole carboxamide ribotide isomerase [Methanophagales archaeon]MCK4733080.1 1-(5-phosphoribosyl)-5-[(5-phosphoribosylamino)methylideneamino]imidazole-4-carboxamide isomerase [Methanophagales archaeon]